MNYREKYLKYKTKYLKLKSIIGGSRYENDERMLDDNDIMNIVTNDFKLMEKVFANETYQTKGTIMVKEMFELLGIDEEKFSKKLLLTSINTEKTDSEENDEEQNNIILNKDIAEKLIKKISKNNLKLEDFLTTDLSKIKKILRSHGYDITNIIEDINCIKKSKENCLGDCRWQPIDNDSKNEIGNTCYRTDYNPKPRMMKPKLEYEFKLRSITE